MANFCGGDRTLYSTFRARIPYYEDIYIPKDLSESAHRNNYSYFYYTEKPIILKTNYANKSWSYTKHWMNPQSDITIARIVYNKNFKIAKIKRTLKQIESHIFRLDKIFVQAFKEIYTLNKIKEVFENDIRILKNQKFKDITRKFFEEVDDNLEFYLTPYKYLTNYYYNLFKYKARYNTIIKIHNGHNICAICFKQENRFSPFTVYRRNYKLCSGCVKSKDKINEDHECPICLESFPYISMTTTNCGNGHQTCMVCYHTLKKIDTRCPICRGAL